MKEQEPNSSNSELAKDYPHIFNNYFLQDKKPSPPLGHEIPKNMKDELCF
jgi:hypothetical protein